MPAAGESIKTTHAVVIQRLIDRLAEKTSFVEDETLFLSLDDEPPDNISNDVFLLLRMAAGTYDEAAYEGGGADAVMYQGSVIVTIFNRTRGRKGVDRNLLLEPGRGLLHLEMAVLKAYCGHMLTDENGQALLSQYLTPISNSDPRHTDRKPPDGSRQLQFATDYTLDLT